MNYKSHTRGEIRSALAEGKEVYTLDTGSAGEDDVLIGSADEVIADILNHHEIPTMPEGWIIERAD